MIRITIIVFVAWTGLTLAHSVAAKEDLLLGLSSPQSKTQCASHLIWHSAPAMSVAFLDTQHDELDHHHEVGTLPVYRRWWFIILAFMLSGLLFAQYGRYRQRAENRKMRKENRQAYYKQQAISSRMNPHFIFNGLNSLQDLILKGDTRNSLDYLNKLSNLMRKNIEYAKEELISLDKERALLRNYCELEELRFDEGLDFSIEHTGEVDSKSCLVPSMVLQPLVENALWHGLKSVPNKKLTISFERIGDELMTIIEDNGIGRKKSAERVSYKADDKNRPHALDFIRRRLQLFSRIFKRDFELTIEDLYSPNGESAGTKCVLRTPYVTKKITELYMENLIDE